MSDVWVGLSIVAIGPTVVGAALGLPLLAKAVRRKIAARRESAAVKTDARAAAWHLIEQSLIHEPSDWKVGDAYAGNARRGVVMFIPSKSAGLKVGMGTSREQAKIEPAEYWRDRLYRAFEICVASQVVSRFGAEGK